MRGFFFNSQPTEDTATYPGGYDRPYDATDLNRYMGAFFVNGVFVHNDANACRVTASGLRLTVHPGAVLVNGGQCHFEGDTLDLGGPGNYSVMCRMNSSVDVRAFQLVALKGDGFPAPVRSGDIYDLCLAHVAATAAAATVTDTRGDYGVCGYASLAGQPPYYPPDSDGLPYPLWLYTLGFPMDAAQKAAVESNPSLMSMFRASRTADADALKKGIVQASAGAALTNLGGERITIPASQISGMGYVAGCYIGDGTDARLISLGFTPKAVLVFAQSYSTVNSAIEPVQIGMAVAGSGGPTIDIVNGGFRVWKGGGTISTHRGLNAGDGTSAAFTHNYIAFR